MNSLNKVIITILVPGAVVIGASYEAYCREVPRWLPRLRHAS